MADPRAFLKGILRRAGIGSDYQLPTREAWEKEYRAGSWDYLGSDAEMPRYAVIATFLRSHCAGGALLDAGCGEGLLLDYLWPGSFASYVGIDFSAEAVARAGARSSATASFAVADVMTWQPPAGPLFDAVIFNEVLYCTPDPARALGRFARFVRPGGMTIASIYEPWMRRMAPILGHAEAAAPWTEAFGVGHPASGRRWAIRIWGAAGAAGAGGNAPAR